MTVSKWRKRETVDNLKTGPKEPTHGSDPEDIARLAGRAVPLSVNTIKVVPDLHLLVRTVDCNVVDMAKVTEMIRASEAASRP
jgi:hypothetical protein